MQSLRPSPTVLGHRLPSWIPLAGLGRLGNFQAAASCTAVRRYPFLTQGIQDGGQVLAMENIVHLLAKLDESFQISMCFSIILSGREVTAFLHS